MASTFMSGDVTRCAMGEGPYRKSDPPEAPLERPSSHGDMMLVPGGVVQLTLPPGTFVDGEKMRQILDAIWDFAPGRRPLLVDGRGATGVTQEAREVAMTGQSLEWTSGVALIVGSIVSVTVAEFVILLARPPFPVRVFRRVDAAREWLASL